MSIIIDGVRAAAFQETQWLRLFDPVCAWHKRALLKGPRQKWPQTHALKWLRAHALLAVTDRSEGTDSDVIHDVD